MPAIAPRTRAGHEPMTAPSGVSRDADQARPSDAANSAIPDSTSRNCQPE